MTQYALFVLLNQDFLIKYNNFQIHSFPWNFHFSFWLNKCVPHFIILSVDKHLGCFHFLTVGTRIVAIWTLLSFKISEDIIPILPPHLVQSYSFKVCHLKTSLCWGLLHPSSSGLSSWKHVDLCQIPFMRLWRWLCDFCPQVHLQVIRHSFICEHWI